MGQSGSSNRRTLFGNDFEKLKEESDYVTLVRVIPKQTNDLSGNPNIQINNNNVSVERRVRRPIATLPNPIRPKTTIEPNVYCDLKDYLRPKSNLIANEELNDCNPDENLLGIFTTNTISRPVSYANHCSVRCVCSDCRLTRYHLLNWLLPNCTRTNAERLLMARPDGTFLVRKSEKFPNQYTLSFVCGTAIRHCLILRSVYGYGLKEPKFLDKESMGQSGSSNRRTLFGNDFEKLKEESDYVTLVRVIPKQTNDLSGNPNIQINNNNVSVERRVRRPIATLPNPIRPKTTIEPNVYCDLKDYLRPKSNLIANEELNDCNPDENLLGIFTTNTISRPVSYANHCSVRCVCSDCRLTRYHLLNWLLPNCTRTNAERLLMARPDGTFLVRKSEKFPNQYTLSFVCGTAIRHCLILRSVYGYGLKEPYKYSTLQQFVLHYAKQSLSEFNWKLNTTLKHPVFA
ncbi:unnamed protein product [Medioppia subpectinata]|uniref:SH2 domain-containing protein n=1 Tax=Medioppia subpectinata TaxID=1979941 RepID=A0A7R9KL32_9ACAR|nr:unnamed protein product [Medioppia subpectinata]CAG2105626.1 unnamed protein product [Medioppia subpectinata]